MDYIKKVYIWSQQYKYLQLLKKDYDYESFKERLTYHYHILDKKGMKYAKPHVFDEADPDESISKVFRNENRFIEYDKN